MREGVSHIKKIIALGGILGLLVGASSVLAAPVVPSQCSGMTFSHTIVSTTYGDFVKGTSGSDLIYVTGGSVVKGGSGNDCIVTSLGGNYIDAESGNDVVVASGSGNSVLGGSGNDNLSVTDNTSFINGGSGHNTCTGTLAVVNCN